MRKKQMGRISKEEAEDNSGALVPHTENVASADSTDRLRAISPGPRSSADVETSDVQTEAAWNENGINGGTDDEKMISSPTIMTLKLRTSSWLVLFRSLESRIRYARIGLFWEWNK